MHTPQTHTRATRWTAILWVGGLMATHTACAIQRIDPEPIYASPMLQHDPAEAPDHHAMLAAAARHDATSPAPQPSRTAVARRRRRSRPEAPTPQPQTSPPSSTSAQPAPPSARSRQRGTLPSLSTMRRAAPSGSQNEKTTLTDAPRAMAGDAPAQAALYVWEKTRRRGHGFDEDAARRPAAMFRQCRARGDVHFKKRAEVGDLVFFHNTFDANDDDRNNDWYTHVALVQKVDALGTMTLEGKQSGGVTTFRLNLENASTHRAESGATLNDQLRPRRKGDLPFTQYLAGELYAGTCAL